MGKRRFDKSGCGNYLVKIKYTGGVRDRDYRLSQSGKEHAQDFV